MGQAVSCCASCCPRLSRKRAAAVPGAVDDTKSQLLTTPRRVHKAKSQKRYRGPPSHLRELSGDINQVVRLVLVGGCDTGKTCLLRRFLGGYFDEVGQQDYNRTLGVDFGCKTVELADHRVRLQMWDTGGSETYRSVVSHYLRGADGVILCFDVNRKATLRVLRSVWAPFLDKHTPKSCRVLLAGNKADSRGDCVVDDAEVSPEDAKRFADAIEAQVFETSAKLGTNVDVAVMGLMQEVLHHRQFAVEEKAGSGSSSTRKGRRRLAVALRDVLESSSEGDKAASCSSVRGIDESYAKAHSSEGTLTEGTSSAESSSASQRDGDGSDQENHKQSSDQRNFGRAWVPFPSTNDGTNVKDQGDGGDNRARIIEPQNVRALHHGIDGEISRDGVSECGRWGGQRRGGNWDSSNNGGKSGGRYRLINQLVIASPSRETRMDGTNVHQAPDTSHRKRRNCDRQNRSGMTEERNLTPSPKLGAACMPATQEISITPMAACSDKEPTRSTSLGVATAMVADERHRLEYGGMVKSGRDTATVAFERKRATSPAAKVREEFPSYLPAAVCLGAFSKASTPPKKTPAQHRDTLGGNFGGDSADSRLVTSLEASANSSLSTVLDGDDIAQYRLASPVSGEE